MSGNKHDNGVHEIGTDEMKKAYMEDTPGQMVERYIEEAKKKNDDVKQKLHFSQKFDNPLKGFPYNESVEVDDGLPEVEDIREASLQQLKRKHKRHIDAFNKRNKDLPPNVEKDLMKFAMDNDGIGDDPDDFDDWLVQNIEEQLDEAKMVLSTPMYNAIMKMGLPQLMKKHDAYVNKKETDKKHTTLSTPSAGFGSELSKMIKKNASKLKKLLPEENIEEAVSPAQQAAIAISKKEKGEKPLEEDSFEEKSKKSGISVATLKKVYRRGVAAWKTGHRPGTTPEQWGHARVNAFIVKKKKGNLNHDKDLA